MAGNVLTYNDLKRKGLDYSRMHLARMVKEGTFPKPFKMTGKGRGTNYWRESDIDAFIDERAKANNKASA